MSFIISRNIDNHLTDIIKLIILDFFEFDAVRKQSLLWHKEFVVEPCLSRFALLSDQSKLTEREA